MDGAACLEAAPVFWGYWCLLGTCSGVSEPVPTSPNEKSIVQVLVIYLF